jgi:hypothetical protein
MRPCFGFALPFAGPKIGKDPMIVRVPLREQARDYVQSVLELVTESRPG